MLRERPAGYYDAAVMRVCPVGLRKVLLVGAITLCLALSGCVKFFRPRTVPVRVVDAETGQPISNATVSVRYAWEYYDVVRIPDREGVTDGDGRVSIAATTYDHQYWVAESSGYLGSDKWQAACMNQTRSADPSDKPSGPILFHLYRGPGPQVVFLVPDGFRGIIREDRAPSPGATVLPPASRYVQSAVSPSGRVNIDYSGILAVTDVTRSVKDASGNIYPASKWNSERNAVLLRFVWGVDHRDLYVLGTKEQELALRSRTMTSQTLDPRSFDQVWNER